MTLHLAPFTEGGSVVPAMEFRLLGVLEVAGDNGPVRIVPGRESALLALLLLHRGEPLPVDRIVEEIWGDAAPVNATKNLQVYVSRLRKTLGPDRIETTAAGYRIRVAPHELDIARFEEELRRGRLADALSLWRGDPLADFRYAPFAQDEARRLEELRDGAVADLLDQRIAAGEHPIAELEALVARAPLWERPRGQLMHALYLGGRQADALELYRRTRSLLADELGVDPGPELQRLEHAILNHDPGLGTPARPVRLLGARRSRLLLTGGALVLAAAATAGVLAATRGSSGLKTIASGTVGAIDPRTNRIVAQIGAGNRPSRLAVSSGRLWVLNAGDRTISEIDTSTYRRVAEFGPNVVPADLAASPGSIWVGASTDGGGFPSSVAHFDATRHNLIGATLLLPSHGPPSTSRPPNERYLIAGGGRLFAIGPTQAPAEISPQTGRIIRTFRTAVTSIAYGGASLWGVDGRAVVRIDPASGATTAFRVPSLFDLSGIAVGGGYVWATSPAEGLVWRIDARPPGQTTSIPLSFGASTIAYGDGSVWVGNGYDDSVSRIDPRTRAVTRVATVPAPQDIAVDPRHVWVASGSTAGRSGPLTTPACGSVQSGGRRPDLLIASDFALQGGEAPTNTAAVATIEAILATHGYRAGRFRVGYQSCDDSTPAAGGFDDGQCLANAASYATDASVVAVIGPSDSPCALDEIPVSNRAPQGPLALVSPFTTGPFLTRHGFAGAAQPLAQFYAGGPRNFFRTIGADHIQVAAAATLARRLAVRRIGVVFNRDGMLQAKEERWFVSVSGRLGGIRAVPILWGGGQRALAAAVRRAHVEGLFLVGAVVTSPSEAAATAGTLGNVLPGKPVIVTDAFGPWAVVAGSRARFYATLAGLVAPAQLSPRLRRLERRLPTAARIPFAVAQTATATEVLLGAIARSDGSRRSIVEALHGISTFDRWGDPRTAPVSVFRVGVHTSNDTRLPSLHHGTLVATITPSVRLVPHG
jgi:DNA-binding SARP family transcriptional activator/DNA-binding beta-propeller fold protein YncE